MQKDTKKLFPWREEYFLARVLLGFSEDEFWQSSPRKVHTLKLLQNKYLRGNIPKKSNKDELYELMSLLGHANLKL